MITAIPMNNDHIASHFSKAEHFLFINDQGVEVSRHENPVLAAHCAGKKALLKLLLQHHAERVVVRNIGQKMLGKLLSHQLSVVQTDSGRRSAQELVSSETAGLFSLTEADQGRPSPNNNGCRHAERRCHSHSHGQGHGHGCGKRHGQGKQGLAMHRRGEHGGEKGHRCCHNHSC
ncbi:NifB/NifX family molybdenum-iron cluster-binding protein [Photobacterium alginatilyticum]|uniref:NifB/NifX family molybdenum-iron cluster-binding protein n=1 Tax=Photobacterium alginatilyticum TaxID=1775171 RepID=UPI004067A082